MRLVIAAVAVCLVLPAAAQAADEQLISAYPTNNLTSTGRWVSWLPIRGYEVLEPPRLWDGTSFSDLPLPPPGSSLGTDRRGNLVAVYVRCPEDLPPCAVFMRRLRSGRVATVLRDHVRLLAAAISRGVLVFSRYDSTSGRRTGLYVRRPGERHSTRYSRGVWGATAVGGGFVEFQVSGGFGDPTRVGVGRLRDHKVRLLADIPDPGCKAGCEPPQTHADQPHIDGHFAYWLTTFWRDASQGGLSTEIDRVDLRDPASSPTAFRPSRAINAFTVSNGVVYYSPREVGGIYRVANPDWQPADITIPLR